MSKYVLYFGIREVGVVGRTDQDCRYKHEIFMPDYWIDREDAHKWLDFIIDLYKKIMKIRGK